MNRRITEGRARMRQRVEQRREEAATPRDGRDAGEGGEPPCEATTSLMTLITYQRRPVAMAAPDRAYLTPQIALRPDSDPLKRFVCLLVLYAHDLQTGRLHGEPRRYLPGRAERYVREQLIPFGQFQALTACGDAELAEIFRVPLEQIAERRRDIAQQPRHPGRVRRTCALGTPSTRPPGA